MRRTSVRSWIAAAMSVLLAAGLTGVVAGPAAAQAAGGPSVDLPPTPSVPAAPQAMEPRPPDQASSRELRGDQQAGSAPKDGGGSPTATSLSASATWSVSAQTGDFHWSYPLRVPPAPGGLVPTLALSYTSSAMDGRTSATNNQPSWVGDGWDLNPGFVERAYGACADDKEGGITPPQVGDLCWRSDNATAAYNGGGGMLIRDSGTGAWRPKHDDGARVERDTGAGNGDDNGEYWKITTVDGTQYFYGSRPESRSTWTVPVFGDDATEPCHNDASFAASRCPQAWRWNLDKVVDARGNTMLLWYEPETNAYGANLTDAAVSYIRGGTLRRIDYGLRAGVTQATGRVEFAVADRCVPGSTCTLDRKDNWPDTPLSERCEAATCRDHWSPTFWSTKRLTSITTQVWRGSGFVDVDRWTLDQQFPDPGDGEKAALWLKSVTHTGLVGGSSALPPVTFEGNQMPNRVYQADNLSPLIRYRITGIVSESGGVISIAYAQPNCVPGSSMPANPESNTLRCFPVRWARPGHAERTDWFHKYVVESVISSDRISSSLDQKVAYEYLDGAAWHYDSSEFTPADKKTYNEFRGFWRVRVRNGRSPDPGGPITLVEQRFHRGMHGDTLPGGGSRSVTVADSEGGTHTDHDWLAGFALESTTFLGDTPDVVSRTVTDPVWQGPTATRGAFKAYLVRTGVQRTFTTVDGGRPRRVTRSETSYDDRGLPTTVSDLGDTSTAADDRCTTTTYVRNTAAWILSLPARVQTVAVHCGKPPTFPDHAITDQRSSYDDQAWGAAPRSGNVTRAEVLDAHPASGPVYTAASTSRYDPHGRVVEAADALGRTVRAAFTPAVGGPTTQTVTTDAKGHATTTTLEPAWGQPVTVTDVNGSLTEAGHDALGRVTQVWLPNRPRSANLSANHRFSYDVRRDAPTAVTATKLGPNGRYVSTNVLYDGLLRVRQAQTPAVGGGRLLTDTRYDSQGRAYKTTRPYFNDSAVDTTLWVASDTQVPGLTVTGFDGAGRPTATVFLAGGVEKWRTTNKYGGDRVTFTPPAGGIPTTVVSDARGRTVQLHQYRAATATGPSDITRYTHTTAGHLASLTDPAGNTWRYTYDPRGRQVRADDPDKGVTTSTYDTVGQRTSQTDARGQTLTHDYDALGRPLTTRAGGPAGRPLAQWTYDTVPYGKGKPATATSYDAVGSAFTSTILTYTATYQPRKTSITIPASEGLLARTYTVNTSFNPDGSLAGQSFPAIAGLDEETVSHTYDDAGRPLTTRGGLRGETVVYASGTEYTRYGEMQRLQLGSGTQRAWLSHYYDGPTRRLDRSIVDAELPRPMQADVHYGYDPAGNVTSIADTPLGLPADTQCFRYDHQRRLTEAWTPGTDCATDPTAGELAGPAPYWQSFGYDVVGNRLTEVRHAAGGNTARSYASPDLGTARPHALTSVTTAGPAGTRTDNYGYDAAGNTTTRGTQRLAWNEQGHLATLTDNGRTTAYVYGTTGQRLLRRDPTATTLYLGGQELRLDHTTGALTGTRHYTHGGSAIAVRTGVTPAGLTWLAGDHHGTAQVAINSATLTATVRRSDPFGNPRGTPPANWPDEKGFVGGTVDAGTGLTHLGAREYDPTTGRFISVDPILVTDDPRQLHAYAYAANNPTTHSDPTGLRIDDAGPPCGTPGGMKCNDPSPPPAPPGKPPANPGCDGRENCAHPSSEADPPSFDISDPPNSGRRSGKDARTVRDTLRILAQRVSPPVPPLPACLMPILPWKTCRAVADALEQLYREQLVSSICADAVTGFCDLPAPDYLSIDVSVSRRFLGVGGLATVTRTGRVYLAPQGSVGMSRSPVNGGISVGWVFHRDGTRASDEEVSGYPAQWATSARIKITEVGGAVGFSTASGLYAAEIGRTTESGSIDRSYGFQVGDLGELWY